VPVRLGEPNAQTSWLVERSGAPLPEFLPHVLLRVCDVMRERFPTARQDDPVREVGLTMAREGLDLVPIVSDDELGTLAHSFNQMLAGLREREALREDLRRELERLASADIKASRTVRGPSTPPG
jgi:CBS domain-containing protein